MNVKEKKQSFWWRPRVRATVQQLFGGAVLIVVLLAVLTAAKILALLLGIDPCDPTLPMEVCR